MRFDAMLIKNKSKKFNEATIKVTKYAKYARACSFVVIIEDLVAPVENR